MNNFWQKLHLPSTFPRIKKSDAGKEPTHPMRGDGGFWKALNRPIFALAPMEDVTGFVFREIFAKYGKPDVMFTEFVNVDGLLHPEGRKKLLPHLQFSEAQRPIVAQIWGRDPEKFYQAAQLISKLGFDGIDINMGCPQDKEIALKTCAALIREPKLAQEIIKATKKGAGALPVSVKTRLGYSRPEEITEWLKYLLETEPAAVTIHGRTKQEKSKVPAHWDKIAEAVQVRDKMQEKRDKDKILILGNGDVKSREEGLVRVKETGVDGVMVGRGAFGNPWFFNSHRTFDLERVSRGSLGEGGHNVKLITVKERLGVLLEHAEFFEKIYKDTKSFAVMRKHFKAYCTGFPGAHELRVKLMEAENLRQARNFIQEHLII